MTNWSTFVTDKDGLTARDFLILISLSLYFLFWSLGQVYLLVGKELNPMYMDMLDSTMPVVIAVVTGVMGVQAVETFQKNRVSKAVDEAVKEEREKQESDSRPEQYYTDI